MVNLNNSNLISSVWIYYMNSVPSHYKSNKDICRPPRMPENASKMPQNRRTDVPPTRG